MFSSILVSPKSNIRNWFGESWSRPLGPKTMKMKGLPGLPKMIQKVL